MIKMTECRKNELKYRHNDIIMCFDEVKMANNVDPDNIPDYIDFQKVLNDSNLTQKDCAKLLKNSERTVSRWYSGEVEVPYSSWKLLLYELGIVDPRKLMIKRISDEVKNIFDEFFEIKKEFTRISRNDPSANPESFVIFDSDRNIYVYKVVFFQNSMRAMIRGVDGKIFEKDIKSGISFINRMLKEKRVISYLPESLYIGADESVERMDRHY